MKSSLRYHGLPVFLLVCLLCTPLFACSSSASGQYAETLTQVSTIDALMEGVYDGVISCGELKKYGNFGIGTFHALDGEMVVLDGKVYQVKYDGAATVASDSVGVPFAAVTYFDTDREEGLAAALDNTAFQTWLDGILPSKNIFIAIKIEGSFTYVKTRSVPAQEKPYPALADVVKDQSVFEFNDVTGTIVGFRCPQYVNGVNVPGYHLHFLTDDRRAGGHVLEFMTDQATASLDYTSEFFMLLPGDDSAFHSLEFGKDNQEELEEIEN